MLQALLPEQQLNPPEKKCASPVWTYALSATQHCYSTILIRFFSNVFLLSVEQLFETFSLEFSLKSLLYIAECPVHAARTLAVSGTVVLFLHTFYNNERIIKSLYHIV